MRDPSDIQQQASEWLIAFSEEEVDTAGQQDFVRWLQKSPQHVATYLRIAAVWELAGDLRERPGIDVNAMIERAHAAEASEGGEAAGPAVSAEEMRPPRKNFTLRPRFAVAACMLLLIVGGALLAPMLWTHAPAFATRAAEQRTVQLSDGSVVQLNARSRLELHYGSGERQVDLIEGQALFSVAHDSRRPFVVRCGGTRISAIGTQFDVNRAASGTMVTVAEGKIAVSGGSSPVSLVAAGEQAFVRSGARPEVHQANVSAVTAWTRGKLVLTATPLHEAIEQLNRTAVRQLVLEDESIRDFHVSGVFPYADPGPLVRFLQQRFGVVAQETDGVVHLRKPQLH